MHVYPCDAAFRRAKAENRERKDERQAFRRVVRQNLGRGVPKGITLVNDDTSDLGREPNMTEEKKDVPVDIAGLMESAFMMGIGVMETTREKMQGLSDELIERGRMSQSDAKRVADRVSEVAGRQQDTLRNTVAEETKRALDAAGVPTREDIESLKQEISELKALILAQRSSSETSE
jgi:polyhydroxyalkanoate synthesis regulator phasin